MGNKKSTITLILVFTGLITVYALVNMRTQSTYKDLNNQIDSLQNTIERNQEIIESYDETIETIKDSIVRLDTKVAENNKQIEQLDKEYDEKFDSIATLYTSELQEYVSNRYKDK